MSSLLHFFLGILGRQGMHSIGQAASTKWTLQSSAAHLSGEDVHIVVD